MVIGEGAVVGVVVSADNSNSTMDLQMVNTLDKEEGEDNNLIFCSNLAFTPRRNNSNIRESN